MDFKQDFLPHALSIAGIGCWEWNLQTESLICTGEVYKLFGLDAAGTQAGYLPFLGLVHEHDRAAILQAFGQAQQNRGLTKVEFSISRPDGTQCTLALSGGVKEDTNGKVITLTGTLQDISLHKQTEKALINREQQYHFILDAVPAMVWTAYPGDKLDYVNTWMINYTGLPARKLFGAGWLTAVHPDDREAVIAAQEISLQKGNPYETEIRFRRTDGSYRWHIRHALPYKEARGNIIKWIGINTDIHEQKLKEEAQAENKLLQEAQQRLNTEIKFSDSILDNSTNGIMAFDSHGIITKWNNNMAFISGRKKEEVIGKTLLELFPEYIAKEEGKAVEQALQGESVRLRRQNNPFRPGDGFYEINLLPLRIEGKLAGGIGTIFEVTEIIRLEQEQADLRLGQQQEILNAILRAQERERERISESLHNGIAQLLFAVRLNLQTIPFQTLPPETRAVLNRVNNLLNEAIRQSRTVSFQLVPTILKDFGLQATLEDLAKTLSSPAISIQVQTAGMETRLEKFLELTVFRIIQALLSNVMEHSGATEARVDIKKNETSVQILVADNGKGFDPATARATVKENSLQTVNNRVALLNGHITIHSASGKGTRISVQLPLSRPDQFPAPEGLPSSSS